MTWQGRGRAAVRHIRHDLESRGIPFSFSFFPSRIVGGYLSEMRCCCAYDVLFYATLDVVERAVRLSHRGIPNVAGFKRRQYASEPCFFAVGDESAVFCIVTLCEASRWAGQVETQPYQGCPVACFGTNVNHSSSTQI